MESRIQIDPNVHFGKPCIEGTRIPVLDVLELISAGISFDNIIKDYYPDLTPDDIRACVQYAIKIIEAEDIHISALK